MIQQGQWQCLNLNLSLNFIPLIPSCKWSAPPLPAPASAPVPVAVNRNSDEPWKGELLVWVGAERQQGLGAPTRPAR